MTVDQDQTVPMIYCAIKRFLYNNERLLYFYSFLKIGCYIIQINQPFLNTFIEMSSLIFLKIYTQ